MGERERERNRAKDVILLSFNIFFGFKFNLSFLQDQHY